MNILRISLPRSVRVGIFWRFGSVEESRPVAVTVIWKEVRTRPSGSMAFRRPSA